jgi:hypothetical protein
MQAYEVHKFVFEAVKPNFAALDPQRNYDMQLIILQNWINENVDPKELKTALTVWLRDQGRNEESLQVQSLKDWHVRTPGMYAYMLINGATLSPKTIEFLNRKLAEALAKYSPEEPEMPEQPELTKAQRDAEQYSRLQGVLKQYANIGSPKWEQVENFVKKLQPSPRAVNEVIKDLKDFAQAAKAAGDRIQIKRLNQIAALLKGLGAKKTQMNVDRVVKVKRNDGSIDRKATKAATKTVSKINYQPYSSKYKVTSIKPEKVIGAKAVLTFDEDSRLINLYVADKDGALEFKGPKLRGWSVEAGSVTRKLRNPERDLEKLVSGGLVRIQRIMTQDLKGAKGIPRPTFKHSTVILKAY